MGQVPRLHYLESRLRALERYERELGARAVALGQWMREAEFERMLGRLRRRDATLYSQCYKVLGCAGTPLQNYMIQGGPNSEPFNVTWSGTTGTDGVTCYEATGVPPPSYIHVPAQGHYRAFGPLSHLLMPGNPKEARLIPDTDAGYFCLCGTPVHKDALEWTLEDPWSTGAGEVLTEGTCPNVSTCNAHDLAEGINELGTYTDQTPGDPARPLYKWWIYEQQRTGSSQWYRLNAQVTHGIFRVPADFPDAHALGITPGTYTPIVRISSGYTGVWDPEWLTSLGAHTGDHGLWFGSCARCPFSLRNGSAEAEIPHSHVLFPTPTWDCTYHTVSFTVRRPVYATGPPNNFTFPAIDLYDVTMSWDFV